VNEQTWIKGMALLVANLKAPDLTPQMATLRGDTYRRKLGHLSDEVWLYAVDAALEEPGGWFPGIGDLLDFASRAPIPAPAAALPDDTRTPDEKREDAKRGLEIVKAAYEERVATLPPRPIVSTPRPTEIIASDERLDELRRQARAIAEQEPTTVEEGRT
jgi:hypothetical protein